MGNKQERAIGGSLLGGLAGGLLGLGTEAVQKGVARAG